MYFMDKEEKISSIEKSINILELISKEKNGLKLKQISTLLNLNASTVHHIISTLLKTGLTIKSEKKYYLGTKMLELTHGYFDNLYNYRNNHESVLTF